MTKKNQKTVELPINDPRTEIAIRKEAGLNIDPQTAEVIWEYGHTIDPYNVYSDLSEEEKQVGRCYFARSPGSDVWVSFCDLPDATHDALWKMHRSVLAFPAGLFLEPAGGDGSL